MSRGDLTRDELVAIDQKLPDLSPLWRGVGPIDPESVSLVFPHKSSVPEASVCLVDTVNVLAEARYAVHEALACRFYYEQSVSPPNPIGAVFFARFYLDDAALRLYAAGEHLANAVICMLEIDRRTLPRRKRTSLQATVARLLRTMHHERSVTLAINELGSAPEWLKTICYRNSWVHQQPPTMAGLGIVFRRGRRWKGNVLRVGGGDKPKLTIDDLSKQVVAALHQAVQCATTIVRVYRGMLETAGIGFSDGGLHLP